MDVPQCSRKLYNRKCPVQTIAAPCYHVGIEKDLLMKLTIFGGTGRTGRLLVEQALNEGHDVTLLARDPAKAPWKHERLRVIQGSLGDAARVAEAIQGTDAVISAAAPTPDGAQHIVQGMQQYGVKRLIVATGVGVFQPQDRLLIIDHAMKALMRVFTPSIHNDTMATVNALESSKLDWTIVRAPILNNNPPTGTVKSGWLRKGVGARLTRADLASYLLSQVADTTYVRQMPAISN